MSVLCLAGTFSTIQAVPVSFLRASTARVGTAMSATSGVEMSMNAGDKVYVPKYGWFGRVGSVITHERPDLRWFYPDHANDRNPIYHLEMSESEMVPYDWLDSYSLWLNYREDRYGGKWWHSSNYWGIYGSNRGRNTPDRSSAIQGEV